MECFIYSVTDPITWSVLISFFSVVLRHRSDRDYVLHRSDRDRDFTG